MSEKETKETKEVKKSSDIDVHKSKVRMQELMGQAQKLVVFDDLTSKYAKDMVNEATQIVSSLQSVVLSNVSLKRPAEKGILYATCAISNLSAKLNVLNMIKKSSDEKMSDLEEKRISANVALDKKKEERAKRNAK